MQTSPLIIRGGDQVPPEPLLPAPPPALLRDDPFEAPAPAVFFEPLLLAPLPAVCDEEDLPAPLPADFFVGLRGAAAFLAAVFLAAVFLAGLRGAAAFLAAFLVLAAAIIYLTCYLVYDPRCRSKNRNLADYHRDFYGYWQTRCETLVEWE